MRNMMAHLLFLALLTCLPAAPALGAVGSSWLDEPTGNPDSKRSGEIGEVLQNLNREAGITVVMVTHNHSLARLAGRTIEVRDGRCYEN